MNDGARRSHRLPSIERLEAALRTHPGCTLLVTHDGAFTHAVVGRAVHVGGGAISWGASARDPTSSAHRTSRRVDDDMTLRDAWVSALPHAIRDMLAR